MSRRRRTSESPDLEREMSQDLVGRAVSPRAWDRTRTIGAFRREVVNDVASRPISDLRHVAILLDCLDAAHGPDDAIIPFRSRG